MPWCREEELLNLVGVGHARDFQNVEAPVAFPLIRYPAGEATYRSRRYLFTGTFNGCLQMGEVRKESKDLIHLQIVDEAR